MSQFVLFLLIFLHFIGFCVIQIYCEWNFVPAQRVQKWRYLVFAVGHDADCSVVSAFILALGQVSRAASWIVW